MDRLICGDVGFGKTEVAMRGGLYCVHQWQASGRFKYPPTLLAQQHYNSFRDRFADWPVKVDVMSRFKNRQRNQSKPSVI